MSGSKQIELIVKQKDAVIYERKITFLEDEQFPGEEIGAAIEQGILAALQERIDSRRNKL